MTDASQVVHNEMMKAMGRSLGRLQEGLKKYPTAKPESRYIRTMDLWRSLTVGKLGLQGIHSVKGIHGGVEGRWGTNVKYAPYVIDQNRQAAHMGRWWTLQGEAKRLTPQVVKEFQAASVRIADKLGPMWTRTITIEVEL